jgi:hypothetical protein
MKLRTRLGMLACGALLAVVPGVGKASTALPSVKGVAIGDYTGGGGHCVDGFTALVVGAGIAVIQHVPFGPVFHAALTIKPGCISNPTSGPAAYTFSWSGAGQLACSGSGTYTLNRTNGNETFAGPVTCRQLPRGLTYNGTMAAALRAIGTPPLVLAYGATLTLS